MSEGSLFLTGSVQKSRPKNGTIYASQSGPPSPPLLIALFPERQFPAHSRTDQLEKIHMHFLDDSLFPENQEKLVITAAPYGPEWEPADFPEDIPLTMDQHVQQ